MANHKKIYKRVTMFSLSWPIFIETSIRMFFLSIDTLMLSAYSDKAVAAAGLITQMTFFILIFYNMIAAGSGIVITQYIGANKSNEYSYAIIGSFALMLSVCAFISLMLSIFANPIIDIFKLENDVHKYALDFFNIFSFFSITFALNTLLSGIFRSFGYTKVPMVINMVAMGLNALGNYCYIFGKFGFPILAVKGVAISSVVSQGIAALAMFTLLKKYHIPFNFKVILKVPIEVYKNILKIGVPNGLETLSFSVTQIVMMGFISNLGTNSLAAYNYTFSIQRIILIFSLSIGQATEIMIGYLVGAKKKFYAYKLVYKNLIIAFSIAAFTSIIVILLRNSLIPIFTKNDDIIQITKTLLLFAFVLETGRTFNMTFIMALKGSGDVNFPLIIGLFSMWIIGVLFSYWLGFVISIGITGIWIAISSDEWFRGIVMYFRWRSKKWMDKSLSD